MNNTQAIINFMYFTNNFRLSDMDKIFYRMGDPNHFRTKWEDARGNNGSEKLRNLFFELSQSNQEIICDYVNENYDGMGFKKKEAAILDIMDKF